MNQKTGKWIYETMNRYTFEDNVITIKFYNEDKLVEVIKAKAYDKERVHYNFISKDTYHCRTCGQLLIYGNDSVIPYSKTQITVEEHLYNNNNQCCGSWHNENYSEGYCYLCGDPVVYGGGTTDRVLDNFVTVPTRKDEYVKVDGHIGYYKICRCGRNTILIEGGGKYGGMGIYLRDLK